EDDFNKTLDGSPSYNSYEKNARMGAISPDGKYMAYVKQGPKLIVREYTGDEDIITEVPWSVKPVWSDNSETLYFTKLTEINDNLRHYWYKYTKGLYAAQANDNFSNIDKLTDLKVYPTDFDSSVNKLLLTWVRPEHKEYKLIIMNPKTKKIRMTDVYSRDTIAAPKGKELAMAKIATPLFFTDPYKKIQVDLLNVSLGNIYFEDDLYIVPNDYSKDGDYFVVSRLFDYKKKSSTDPVKRYYGMYAINRKNGDVQEFVVNYFGNFEVNFREGTNELVFTSRLSW
ncbi:MAG: hypothetical protein ACOCV1_07110, partial [Bacillota bacterium]